MYSTGNERQTPTGGTISEQIYLGFTKNKHIRIISTEQTGCSYTFTFYIWLHLSLTKLSEKAVLINSEPSHWSTQYFQLCH